MGGAPVEVAPVGSILNAKNLEILSLIGDLLVVVTALFEGHCSIGQAGRGGPICYT